MPRPPCLDFDVPPSEGARATRPGHGEVVLANSLDEEFATTNWRSQLRPYAQPVVDLTSGGRLLGAESLLRWQHPSRGVLPAEEFIHLVERAELLAEVDLATAERLATELALHDSVGDYLERIWLNVSVSEIFSDRFLESVASISQRTGLGRGRLGLDVPELVFAIDESPLKRRLASLRSTGVAVAIDHFGTELRLGHLGSFGFDAIKLDRSLVERVGNDNAARRMVSAAVEFGHASGATVIAERVERPTQMEVLQQLGCDGGQGYLLGAPVPLHELLGNADREQVVSRWFG